VRGGVLRFAYRTIHHSLAVLLRVARSKDAQPERRVDVSRKVFDVAVRVEVVIVSNLAGSREDPRRSFLRARVTTSDCWWFWDLFSECQRQTRLRQCRVESSERLFKHSS
jgi:hypothetical protein